DSLILVFFYLNFFPSFIKFYFFLNFSLFQNIAFVTLKIKKAFFTLILDRFSLFKTTFYTTFWIDFSRFSIPKYCLCILSTFKKTFFTHFWYDSKFHKKLFLFEFFPSFIKYCHLYTPQLKKTSYTILDRFFLVFILTHIVDRFSVFL
ncbi:hypothetical protein L9F63_008275, partial [Diploptera punctata]